MESTTANESERCIHGRLANAGDLAMILDVETGQPRLARAKALRRRVRSARLRAAFSFASLTRV